MAAEMTDPTLDVPPPEEGPGDGIHRILIVADERFRAGDFLAELRSHMKVPEATVQIYIVAPALAASPMDHEMANFDEPIAEARERLDAIIADLKTVGLEALGRVGDGDPVTAVGDGLREFPADEVIVISHVESQRAYAEKDLWERLRLDYSLPISDIQVGRPDEAGEVPEVVRVDHEPAKPQTHEQVIRKTRNFPPLQKRDTAGILIGLLGTFFLGLIAVLANVDEAEIRGRNAAIILIAIGSFLLNAAHVVGLLFFQSVRYTGFWEKFMARVSFGYTVTGIIAALVLWLA